MCAGSRSTAGLRRGAASGAPTANYLEQRSYTWADPWYCGFGEAGRAGGTPALRLAGGDDAVVEDDFAIAEVFETGGGEVFLDFGDGVVAAFGACHQEDGMRGDAQRACFLAIEVAIVDDDHAA